MQKMFCDVCGKELKYSTEIEAKLNLGLSESKENKFANHERMLKISAIMTVEEKADNNYFNEKFYEILNRKELCVNCGRKLKSKLESAAADFFTQKGVKNG